MLDSTYEFPKDFALDVYIAGDWDHGTVTASLQKCSSWVIKWTSAFLAFLYYVYQDYSATGGAQHQYIPGTRQVVM